MRKKCELRMISGMPYVLRALIEWINDSGLTPYIVANTKEEGVSLPSQLMVEDLITLNIGEAAVCTLFVGEEDLSFEARFSGIARKVIIPLKALHMIYAKENGTGAVFKNLSVISLIPPDHSVSDDKDNSVRASDKPRLTIVE